MGNAILERTEWQARDFLPPVLNEVGILLLIAIPLRPYVFMIETTVSSLCQQVIDVCGFKVRSAYEFGIFILGDPQADSLFTEMGFI